MLQIIEPVHQSTWTTQFCSDVKWNKYTVNENFKRTLWLWVWTAPKWATYAPMWARQGTQQRWTGSFSRGAMMCADLYERDEEEEELCYLCISIQRKGERRKQAERVLRCACHKGSYFRLLLSWLPISTHTISVHTHTCMPQAHMDTHTNTCLYAKRRKEAVRRTRDGDG